jgi:hypothetical protein
MVVRGVVRNPKLRWPTAEKTLRDAMIAKAQRGDKGR